MTDDENDAIDSGEEEQEDEDVLEEVGEDRRDPVTGSVESVDDLGTIPEEIVGRAGRTNEDLTALFRGEEGGHFRDAFQGGSDDDPADIPPDDIDDDPDAA